jgi:putative peptidoglycan lipid II flippase
MAGESLPTSGVSASTASRAPSLGRAAGLMGLATLISRVLGLVREQAFAYLFGASHATDAFNVAFRIPNLLRDLFAEGAMSAALVPTFTRARVEQGDRRAWRVAGLVFRVLFVSVTVLSLVGIWFAPELVALYSSAYREVPGKFELTVSMTRTLFPFFPLVALAAAFMAVLNACGVYFMPAFASALFNVASITVGVGATLILFERGEAWGVQPIEGMAIGVLAGGLVQALCQLPALRRVGYAWPKREPSDLPWHQEPALRAMLALMLPGLVGLAATQVSLLVNTILATSQQAGAVSWLNYSFRLMQFPIGVFGVSIAAATLPRVSRQWVEKKPQEVAGSLSEGLRYVFAINLPAAAGLAFLGVPIIALIFEYGRFSPEDTSATAQALAAYSAGLVAYSAVKVLGPACYALGNTRVAVIGSVATVAITIVLNVLSVSRLGFWALAAGTSAGAVFNALFLLFALRRDLRKAGAELEIAPLFRSFFIHSAIAIAMGWACFASHSVVDSWSRVALASFGLHEVFLRGISLFLVILEAVVLVLVLARVLGADETGRVLGLFYQRAKNKLSRRKT